MSHEMNTQPPLPGPNAQQSPPSDRPLPQAHSVDRIAADFCLDTELSAVFKVGRGLGGGWEAKRSHYSPHGMRRMEP
jgi:hypothetical protein